MRLEITKDITLATIHPENIVLEIQHPVRTTVLYIPKSSPDIKVEVTRKPIMVEINKGYAFIGPKGDQGPQGPQGEPGTSGVSEWGFISGNIEDQVDLLNALNGKENHLENPVSDWQVLASTTDGVRQWIDVPYLSFIEGGIAESFSETVLVLDGGEVLNHSNIRKDGGSSHTVHVYQVYDSGGAYGDS